MSVDIKGVIARVISRLKDLDEVSKKAIEGSLWETLPKILKDTALKRSALSEMLCGEASKWDNETEVSFLSRVLAYPSKALPMCSAVTIEHFYEPFNALVWLACATLWKQGKVVSTDTVYSFLNERGHKIDVLALDALPSAAPANTDYTWNEFPGLIGTLSDYALARNVVKICLETAETIFTKSAEESPAIRTDAIARLGQIKSGTITKVVDAATLSDEFAASYAEKLRRKESGEDVFGVPTGFWAMDKLIGGWQKSDLIIIAARPSMGKTALLLALLYSAAKAGKPVLFFSMEMSRLQIMTRLFAISKEVDYKNFRDTVLSESEQAALTIFSREFASLPFFIEDSANLSAQYISDVTGAYVQSEGVELVGVDYLQLMKHSTDHKADPTRTVANASNGLKSVAKRYNVPVIALSQLNREVDKRVDKIPTLSDLRQAGEIEQDADIVGFVYRPEYYHIEANEGGVSTAGLGQLVIAKHRNGALDTVDMFYDRRYASFKELSQRPDNYGDFAPAIDQNYENFAAQFITPEDDLGQLDLTTVKF